MSLGIQNIPATLSLAITSLVSSRALNGKQNPSLGMRRCSREQSLVVQIQLIQGPNPNLELGQYDSSTTFVPAQECVERAQKVRLHHSESGRLAHVCGVAFLTKRVVQAPFTVHL